MATLDLTGSAHTHNFRLQGGPWPRFWSRWGPFQRGLWVLAQYVDGGWVVTDYPGTQNIDVDDINASDFAWRGGQTHDFTDVNGLVTQLDGLGYTVT